MLTVRGALALQRLLAYSFCLSWLRGAITLAPYTLHCVTSTPCVPLGAARERPLGSPRVANGAASTARSGAAVRQDRAHDSPAQTLEDHHEPGTYAGRQ